jgi:hypothetical protein
MGARTLLSPKSTADDGRSAESYRERPAVRAGSYSDVGIAALIPTFWLCRLEAWRRVFCRDPAAPTLTHILLCCYQPPDRLAGFLVSRTLCRLLVPWIRR